MSSRPTRQLAGTKLHVVHITPRRADVAAVLVQHGAPGHPPPVEYEQRHAVVALDVAPRDVVHPGLPGGLRLPDLQAPEEAPDEAPP